MYNNKNTNIKDNRTSFSTISGFTVLELIVVIIVIGVLSVIVLLNYGKWQESIVITKIKNDLSNAKTAMEDSRIYNNGLYPESLPASFNSGSPDLTMVGGSADGGSTYCVNVSHAQMGLAYYITSENTNPQIGSCSLTTVYISSNKNINTDVTKTGRTCADGVNYSVTSLSSNSATLSSNPATGCLVNNDEILLINLQGTSSRSDNVGKYEILKVSSVVNNVVTFQSNKSNRYGDMTNDDSNIGINTSNQRVMIQRVPTYTNLTLKSGSRLTANSWNGVKGGVLFIKVTETADISGVIDMSGKGWRGGTGGYWCGGAGESYNGGPIAPHGDASAGTVCTSSNANGGGGGGGGSRHLVDGQTGGAGGAGYAVNGVNGGKGRYGGTFGYRGLSYGSNNLSKIYFGSGGGGNAVVDGLDYGSGGNGGGIVMIFSGSISVSGKIVADGIDMSATYHQSSGGSGGVIYITGTSVSVGSNKVTAKAGVSGSGAAWNPPTYMVGQSGSSSNGRIRITGTLTGTTNPSAFNG